MAKKQPSVRDFVVVDDPDELPEEISGLQLGRVDPNVRVPEPDVDEEKRRLQDALAAEVAAQPVDEPAVMGAGVASAAPTVPMPDLSSLDPAVAAIMGAILLSQQQMMSAFSNTLERLVQGQSAGSQAAAQALKRAQQPDNTHAPAISVYNPQGDLEHPKPMLKCPMLLPWEADRDSLTFEEIELLNLLEPGEFTIRRIDGTKLSLTINASVQPNDRTKYNRLVINHETGFNNDNFRLMGPMSDWLRQILKQRPHTHTAAQKVLTMEEREDLVRGGQLPVSKGA